MMDYYGNYGLVAGLLMLLFWLLVIAGIVFAIRFFTRNTAMGSSYNQRSALELLDERLARGEISVAEYHERKAALLRR